jgi:hypothetical protein
MYFHAPDTGKLLLYITLSKIRAYFDDVNAGRKEKKFDYQNKNKLSFMGPV